MAVSKLWPVTVRLATVLDYASNPEKTTKSKSKYSDADYQALRDVVAYAKDGEKTERELFCEGIHCNPQTAREQFITVKEQFDKPDGIQAYHGYLSFEETDITPELAQQVGMAFAERMWGDRFQVLVTTHLNTEHLHCHFVVNSVSFRDGKRLQNKEKAWWYFRHIADEVCLEHGLSVVQNPEAYQSPRILTQKDKAGMPTRYNLARAALDEAIAMSHNLRQLEYHLSEMGYALGSNPKRKYWTIRGKGEAGEREIPMTEGVKQAFLMEREFQSQAEISSKSRVDGYDDFIFVNRYGDVQNQGNLNKALHRMMRDCNDEILEKYGADSDPVLLPQFSCHILRHTFATRLCESGANLKFIQSILGHADVSTTMNIYVDVTDALKKKEITAFDDYMTTKLET